MRAPRSAYIHVSADAKSLYVTKILHGLSEMGIAIVRHTRVPKVLAIDLAKGPTGIFDFDAISEPRNADRGVCPLVEAVHDRIPCQLLQGHNGIIEMTGFYWLGHNI